MKFTFKTLLYKVVGLPLTYQIYEIKDFVKDVRLSKKVSLLIKIFKDIKVEYAVLRLHSHAYKRGT